VAKMGRALARLTAAPDPPALPLVEKLAADADELAGNLASARASLKDAEVALAHATVRFEERSGIDLGEHLGEITSAEAGQQRFALHEAVAEARALRTRLSNIVAGLEPLVSQAVQRVAGARADEAEMAWLVVVEERNAVADELAEQLRQADFRRLALIASRGREEQARSVFEAACVAAERSVPSLSDRVDEPEWDAGTAALVAFVAAGSVRPVETQRVRMERIGRERAGESEKRERYLIDWAVKNPATALKQLSGETREKAIRERERVHALQEERRLRAEGAREFPTVSQRGPGEPGLVRSYS
jgi:hypothetical protein